MTERKKYDLELLELHCRENNVVLLQDYGGQKITRNSVISFRCLNCESPTEKGFRYIIENGGWLCKVCTKLNRKEKVKKTDEDKKNPVDDVIVEQME